MSAYWKIPLQVIVLLVGVLVFVYYTFNPAPLIFSGEAESRVRNGVDGAAYRPARVAVWSGVQRTTGGSYRAGQRPRRG